MNGSRDSRWLHAGRLVRAGELLIQCFIFYGLITYFLELETGASEGHPWYPFFLWSERIVALVFTVEYLVRWAGARDRLRYPLTPLAVTDLLAVLPFYLGFMVDLRSLRLIRTLRILRMFKLYRYNEALQSFVRTYSKVKQELSVLGVAVFLLVLLSGTVMYEAERGSQPEAFSHYSDGLWWSVITLSTVGYGDKCPVTPTGRIAATLTLVVGLGLFASLVSVVGGAFVATLNERKNRRQLVLFPVIAARLAELLEKREEELSEEEANRLLQQVLEDYRRESLADEEPNGSSSAGLMGETQVSGALR